MFNFFRFSSLLLIFEEEKKEQINGFIFDLLAFLKLLDPDQTPGSGSNSWIWFRLLDPDQLLDPEPGGKTYSGILSSTLSIGFEEISKQLSIKVVIKVKSAHKTVEDLSYFVSQHILDRPSLLKVLMELIYTTDIEKCTNCLLPLDECKDGQPISSVPHLGLRQGGL